ncbi:MAG: hypothetical protein ABJH05_05165 [Fulvivirga sp.]
MYRNLKIGLFLGAVLALSGCKKDEAAAPSEKVIQFEKLANEWHVTSVMHDDINAEGYDDFSVTFLGNSSDEVFLYKTDGRPENSPWPSSGTWNFGETIANEIVRDANSADELKLNYSLSDNILTIEFDFNGVGYSNGKVNSTTGHWVFSFDI